MKSCGSKNPLVTPQANFTLGCPATLQPETANAKSFVWQLFCRAQESRPKHGEWSWSRSWHSAWCWRQGNPPTRCLAAVYSMSIKTKQQHGMRRFPVSWHFPRLKKRMARHNHHPYSDNPDLLASLGACFGMPSPGIGVQSR
jgi:hypothetical protein